MNESLKVKYVVLPFPRRRALFSAVGKVLEPRRHRDLLRDGRGGASADGRIMDAVFVASWRFLRRIYVLQMRHALGTVVQADHRAEAAGGDLPRGEDVAEVEALIAKHAK